MREFMHVDDLAEAVLFCLEKWNPNLKPKTYLENGEILNFLNVGTGKEVSIKNLAEMIIKETNSKSLRFWGPSKQDFGQTCRCFGVPVVSSL